MNRFALILLHSPLVGPTTWALAAEALRRRGHIAVVPTLESNPGDPRPFWRQHVDAAATALDAAPLDTPLVLVGHSGGGMLLPAIREISGRPVARYIFVDAAIPQDGKSRLDLFESSEAVQGFRSAAVDGFMPVWSDEDLREVIPDDEVRRKFVAELKPMPIGVYEEPIPVFTDWPDGPVSYLRFGQNPAYDADAERARREKWEIVQMDGAHFHMLVAPDDVTEALIRMASGEVS